MYSDPIKTKALVISRSGTVNLPDSDLILYGVFIRARPNLDILGVKFDSKVTFKDHMRGIVSGIGILRLVKHVLWIPLRYFVAIINLSSHSLINVLRCGGLVMNVTVCLMFSGVGVWWCMSPSAFLARSVFCGQNTLGSLFVHALPSASTRVRPTRVRHFVATAAAHPM